MTSILTGIFFNLFETARFLVKLLIGSWEVGIPFSSMHKLYRSVKDNRDEQDSKELCLSPSRHYSLGASKPIFRLSPEHTQ